MMHLSPYQIMTRSLCNLRILHLFTSCREIRLKKLNRKVWSRDASFASLHDIQEEQSCANESYCLDVQTDGAKGLVRSVPELYSFTGKLIFHF